MKITLLQHSAPAIEFNEPFGGEPFIMGAKIMATCVSNNPVEAITTEPIYKTLARRDDTLVKRHHSGYDFETVTLAMEDVSKIFCMYLNNLHAYCTEETSGRHKDLILPDKEKAVFDYFYDKIYNTLLEQNPDAENDKKALRKIKQVARENARYTTGLDAKTNICYGISLRQLNYIYAWAEKFLDKQEYNIYEELAIDDMREFIEQVDGLEIGGQKLINNTLKKDPYGREFNLFGDFERKPEYYGAAYEVYYNASSTAFAQLQRHRPIYYTINNPDKDEDICYYIPDNIRNIEGLADEWYDKIDSLNNVPQARLLDIREVGNYESIVARLKERACCLAQEETRKISSEVAHRVFVGMEQYDYALARDLCDRYLNKNRCFFDDYERCACDTPCKKSDVITFDLERW